jgi:hypothetical protein
MSSEDESCEQIKIDYILNAVRLAQSFAIAMRRALQSGNRIEAASARENAEHFYSNSIEMLSMVKVTEISELVHQLANLRRQLDDIDRESHSASA